MKPIRFQTLIPFAALALVLMVSLTACKRTQPAVNVGTTDEEGPQLASIIHTKDQSEQLVTGFYNVEENAWRWTAQKFSVVLKPPVGSAQRGATLTMQCSIPDAVIAKLKTVSLTGTIGATALAPETYTQPGPYTYTRDIPANLLNADAVRVDFQLDKALPPGANGDQRELGIIVSSVGLEAK
jgi:hypothetical protein